jgi:hypothetical protein
VSARHDAVKAINRRAKKQANRSKTTDRGVVVGIEPLKVDVFHGPVLKRARLDLSQWAKWYDKEYGIDKGDNVLLMRHGSRWTVTDVISNKEV